MSHSSSGTEPERQSTSSAGWTARIKLEFLHKDGQTYLGPVRHEGPLYAQRPFTDETGTCQVYLLHPPGGVVGGDELLVDVDVAGKAQGLITAPGAAKLYRSAGREALITQRVTVRDGASFEWMPQDTIVFDGAHANVCTEVRLDAAARFMGWEGVSLGRPAAGERFSQGRVRFGFELWKDTKPVWLDRMRLAPGDPLLDAPFGLQGHPIVASFLATPADEQALAKARSIRPDDERDAMAATLVDGVLSCRYLGDSTMRARNLFLRLWSELRPLVLGKPAVAPRIWAT